LKPGGSFAFATGSLSAGVGIGGAMKEKDFGGCRCQAFLLTGDARNADPVCHLAPQHAQIGELAAMQTDAAYHYRR
jgi:hypothetical protein